MTDPIADLLARIRNAITARKAKVEIPASKLKRQIAEIFLQEGFVSAVEDNDQKPQGSFTITLRYGHDHRNAISGMKRVSRPGQRRYVAKDELPRVRSGLGMSVLTTSRGLMTDRAARKAGIGGELVCEVW